jgi:hypothetical protein
MTEKTKKARSKPEQSEQKTIDWEKVANHLQEALEGLLVEHIVLEKEHAQLVRDNLKLIHIVQYLESKVDSSNYSV